MTNAEDRAQEDGRKSYGGPYTKSHPVPTVQKHREERHHLEADLKKREEAQDDDEDDEQDREQDGTFRRLGNKILGRGKQEKASGDPYPSQNRYTIESSDEAPPVPEKDTKGGSGKGLPSDDDERASKGSGARPNDSDGAQPASQATDGHSDPRKKRKAMKHAKRDDGGREVTDPVTHLPIVIHDVTDSDLNKAPENEPTEGEKDRNALSKSSSRLNRETKEQQSSFQGMRKLFPPPSFDNAQSELMRVYGVAVAVGTGSIVICATIVMVISQLLQLRSSKRQADGHDQSQRTFIPIFITVLLSSLFGSGIIWAVSGWLKKRVEEVWEDEIWDGDRMKERQEVKNQDKPPESTQWLNSLFASVWPLINPDLFTSLADTLEDVMQASLPKLVRMVSVDDIGQGSEAFRILGVRWLPTGAASQNVDAEGNVKQEKAAGKSGQNTNKKDSADSSNENSEDDDTSSGLKAEEGDFVNMEIAFAYRARSTGKSLRTKSKNAHLYLKFYMPANIALPVWVELRGIIGTMRVRLQLTPDPPFFSIATITFLGQPKADLSCVPLSKHNLNIMDLPLISSFVQSSIDAALAEYVAPKSLTLDLKGMLVGDDFKKDTTAKGVIVVRIKKATDFKEGDGNLGPLKKGSSDGYVAIGWAKFGKPVATTRIIVGEQFPVWDEYAYVLVTAEEINAKELLSLQIWDSDRTSADDDLGRVEVDLKDLMESAATKGIMCEREDSLKGPNDEEEMPGTISWDVGYFQKKGITADQLANQQKEPDINNTEELKQKVDQEAEQKLREATAKDESRELTQQKAQDYKEREDDLIVHSPASDEYPSGILSIQIHQITGLQLEKLNHKRSEKRILSDSDEDDEDSDDLPSAYCTIILNHAKIFKTRTKPKNAKPFFNAGCERFVRDWRTTEVMISVRDARVHENHPLLGIVDLPLSQLFKNRSQVVDNYPLAGGIGYGRARISIVFRSVELQAPQNLLGWDYGTIEILEAKVGNFPEDLRSLKIKLRSTIASSKMVPNSDNEGSWKPKHKSGTCMAVRKRYSTPLVVEFYRSSMLTDSLPAFAVIWFKEIPDDEDTTVKLKVWKHSKNGLKRAETCTGYDGMDKEEEPLGELELTLKFWRGLSGYHQSVARRAKEKDLHDVMEVLDSANSMGDRKENDEETLNDNGAADTDTSDSSSSSDDSDSDPNKNPVKDGLDKAASSFKSRATDLMGNKDGAEDGRRGPGAQIQDYKEHHKSLHRRHRGLMQWKGPRTVEWMMGKASRGKDNIGGLARHGEREPGVETEV